MTAGKSQTFREQADRHATFDARTVAVMPNLHHPATNEADRRCKRIEAVRDTRMPHHYADTC
jgi:hypothetical protein